MTWDELLYMGDSESSNPINRFDTRVKILFLSAALILILLTKSPLVPVYYTVLSMALVVLADVNLHQFVLRLVAPLLVVSMLIVIQSFFYGETPFLRIPVGGLNLTVYREGLLRGLLLAVRVMGGVSLIIVLSLTSSILSLLSALKFFRVPRSWLEIVFLSYRYLFVFIQHVTTSYQAQKVRLGYRTPLTALRSAGTLTAHLFLHIFDQTRRTFDAMRLRGYRGFLPVPEVRGELSPGSVFLGVLLFLPGVILAWG